MPIVTMCVPALWLRVVQPLQPGVLILKNAQFPCVWDIHAAKLGVATVA
jgi:hypothetical protein